MAVVDSITVEQRRPETVGRAVALEMVLTASYNVTPINLTVTRGLLQRHSLPQTSSSEY